MCLCCDRLRLKINGTQDKTARRGPSVVHLGFDVSSSDFPTLSMNICSPGPFLPCLASPNFSSSFTSAVLCYFFLPLHPPPLLLHFCFSRSVCLAHTGDNSGSKHSRVKTNSFCQNENKPLSPCSLSLSLLFPLMLFLSSSLLFSRSENKLPSLYLFYQGRPDHQRESFKLFQTLPA